MQNEQPINLSSNTVFKQNQKYTPSKEARDELRTCEPENVHMQNEQPINLSSNTVFKQNQKYTPSKEARDENSP